MGPWLQAAEALKAPSGLLQRASLSRIYTARSWHPGQLMGCCIFYLDSASSLLQVWCSAVAA